MSANGISTLATKELRQTAKLTLAEARRKGYATIEQNTTAYSLPTNFSLGDVKITDDGLGNTYLQFYNSVPTISDQLTVGTKVTIDWDGRAPNTVAYIASTLIDFPGNKYAPGHPGFLLTIITTTELPGTLEDYNIEALHVPNGTFTGSGIPDTTAPFYRARNVLDITLLPDTYNGNEPGADDNANTGGLVEGRPWTSAVSIRSFLSGSGQTAYDAASSGSWFAVSSTDWDAAVAGISGATKKLVTDGQMTEASGAAFSSAYIITQAQAAATITAGNYIFALRGNTAYSNQSWTIYGGTTYKSLAYSAVVSGTPATASTGTYYYLRKAPTALASTTYIGIVGSQNLTMTSSSTFAGAAFIASPYNTGSWGNWSGVQPKVQVVITSSPVA